MHIIMPMHYVTKIEIEPFPPSGPPNFQNMVAPMPVSCCVMSVLLIKFTITKLLTDEKFKYISLVNAVYCYLCHKYR